MRSRSTDSVARGADSAEPVWRGGTFFLAVNEGPGRDRGDLAETCAHGPCQRAGFKFACRIDSRSDPDYQTNAGDDADTIPVRPAERLCCDEHVHRCGLR